MEKGSLLRRPLRNLRHMQIARYSFLHPMFRLTAHECSHKCFLRNTAPLVGRFDHFCPRDRCNMPAGFWNWGFADRTCRAQQEERIAVASWENFVVWPHRSPTVPGDVIVSELDLAEQLRKRPDTVATALNLLLNEQKVQRATLSGYWKLHVWSPGRYWLTRSRHSE